MASPWKHPRTERYYLRERVPQDLAAKVKGRRVTVSVDGRERTVTLGEMVKVSLGTKEATLAKERYREAAAAVQEMWGRFRQEASAGPVRLTGRQVEDLAGRYYRSLIQEYEDDPGPPGEAWQHGIDAARDLSKRDREKAYGEEADWRLSEAGLTVDTDSRTRLLEAMNRANIQAHEVLARRAEGDYSPDPLAERFPILPSSASGKRQSKPAKVTLSDLFELWKTDHLREGRPEKTVRDFRQKLDSFIAFIGHEDVERVTPQDIVAWTDHLRDKGITSRTVAQKYLVAVKRIFTVGKRKFRITDNPAAEVVVEVKKATRTRSPGFTDEEAKTLLSAALRAPVAPGKMSMENRLAVRWGHWLCAYTGARIGEMMQLRKQDVEIIDGIPTLRITPEAATVKSGNYRMVPVHPHLIEMGFLDFVRSRPGEYLFFNLTRGGDPLTRVATLVGKVGGWVRQKAGITDPRLQPNHAWRHRFKTIAREVGIPAEDADAIQGHEDGRASSAYGEHTVQLLLTHIEKLPRYRVDG